MKILYEDNHLLAVCKPAGQLSMGDTTGDWTAVDDAADYIKRKYNKPGNVFVGVVHRLDRPVTGVLLFARTSKAAGRLSDQFRRGTVTKKYLAVVQGHPKNEATLHDWLLKDRTENRSSVVEESTTGAKRCELSYRLVARSNQGFTKGLSLLEVSPATGRSHQIRVQLASRGLAIVGDLKYGAGAGLDDRILLHATRLEIEHPVRREPLILESAPEGSEWGEFRTS